MSEVYDSYVAEIDLGDMSQPDCFRIFTAEGAWVPVAIKGARLYVRKDKGADDIGGIFIPDIAYKDVEVVGSDLGDLSTVSQPKEDANTAIVMAVGPKVNTNRINCPIRVGSRIVVEGGGQGGILRSPYSYADYFLDETVPICLLEEDA